MSGPTRRGWSLFWLQSGAFLLLILGLTATLGWLVAATAGAGLEAEIGRKLVNTARLAAAATPPERLILIEPGAERTRLVRRLEARLEGVVAQTGVVLLQVCDASGRLLLDPSPGPLIGSACAGLPATTRAALEGGESRHGPAYERGGAAFMDAFAPLAGTEGLVAYVRVSAGARELEIIARTQVRLYVAAGLVALIALGVGLLFARFLTRPIRLVAETAERIGQGDYAARAPRLGAAELSTLADSMNAMAEQVAVRDTQLRQMTATVAHEVRNPLNSVKLLITLLDEELADAGVTDQRQTIDTLHYEIGKLDRFLSEFLTFSRPTTIVAEPALAHDLAEAATRMAAAASEDRGVLVEVRPDPDSARVMADRQRLEQCLLNVVLNGVQASSEGGLVEVSVRRDGDEVEFAVEDRGDGIPEDLAARLFEPFFTTKETGTGLGLSNARRIVEAHGGTLTVVNRAGGGARSQLRLPALHEEVS